MKEEQDIKQYENSLKEEYLDPLHLSKKELATNVGLPLSNLKRNTFSNLETLREIEQYFNKLHSSYGEDFRLKIVLTKKRETIFQQSSNRVIKNLQTILIDGDVVEIIQSQHKFFAKAIIEFKTRRRYNKYVKVGGFDLTGKCRQSFTTITNNLEDLRVKTLGINRDKFYRLVTEFIFNGRKYVPLNQIFAYNSSEVSEEFWDRVITVLMHIVNIIPKAKEMLNEVEEFKSKLKGFKFTLDLRNATYKMKDWYCIAAFLQYVKEKQWSEDTLYQKMYKAYHWDSKLFLPERMIMDMDNGHLDKINPDPKKKSFGQEQEAVVRKSKGKWFEDFKKSEQANINEMRMLNEKETGT